MRNDVTSCCNYLVVDTTNVSAQYSYDNNSQVTTTTDQKVSIIE